MDSFKYRSEMKGKHHRKKWDGKWDGNEKPAEYQRVYVVSGRIELPTHGFSVHCSTI